jgi:hypothetical protein
MTGGTFSLFAHVGSKFDNPKKQIMTIEEYKAQPFKDATIGDYWSTFDRRTRREIERLVKKGKNPDIMKYI